MSLTIPPRIGAPLPATPTPAPTPAAAEPASAPPARINAAQRFSTLAA